MDLLQASQRLVPELAQKFRSRYRVLQRIFLHQPIGRRSLAQVLGTTERILRADVELFKEQGLIDVGPIGMSVTDAGEILLADLDKVIRKLDGRRELEQQLATVLAISRVTVVPGDCEQDDAVMRDIGHAAAQMLQGYIVPPCTVAVTGGSTMATLAEMMPRVISTQQVEVLPARGGLGERVELLANTIASQLADKLGGTYRMFHVPESLSKATVERLSKEPVIQEMAERIRRADIVVHGIGDALTMALRRQLDDDTVAILQSSGAVAEAFGYYFDAQGAIVYTMNTVGMRLEDLAEIDAVIAVAGGRAKGAAIRAASRAYQIDALVTDEGAARAILEFADVGTH
ncbi:sugar-binding transcriptional regulator [Sulfoacidibacillus ferrooxidans]|uniref:Central glycolytic transcription regulator n=1 Tax=Sulfoacidibacillus ferrooxidans TaxID=2005001 RepID=A0A9X1V5X8_9BACL|nr:sugar-binding domain-containing protein [Sulfoacidibacillus ferrooxidans]MCI0182251.1 Central glycolytic transcription regulator [Sulfoacidibacillus ferrooxidans]